MPRAGGAALALALLVVPVAGGLSACGSDEASDQAFEERVERELNERAERLVASWLSSAADGDVPCETFTGQDADSARLQAASLLRSLRIEQEATEDADIATVDAFVAAVQQACAGDADAELISVARDVYAAGSYGPLPGESPEASAGPSASDPAEAVADALIGQ